jgi:hypothetical protein
MIAYCGLDCGECPIHKATLESDLTEKRRMRSEIARMCREKYGLPLVEEDVGNCEGCQSTRLFVTCSVCGIRKCAQRRNLDSCARCGEFACLRLRQIFREDPAARTRLEALRPRE